MSFDVEGARKAGYTDAEIADHLAGQSKFDAAGARKSGYTDADIISHLSQAQSTQASAPQPQKKPLNPLLEAAMLMVRGIGPLGGASDTVKMGLGKIDEASYAAG